MIDLHENGRKKFPTWWQDWRGECVAIVGGGPTAKIAGVEKLRDRIHVVVINESYQLCPWADILYSCDAEWWKLRQEQLKKFAGIKIGFRPPGDLVHIKNVNSITIPKRGEEFLHDFFFDEPGTVGSGGHSGFQAINLMAQFGCTGIGLVGFDMNSAGGVHWHGMHPSPLRNPDAERFREWPAIMDRMIPKLIERGIDVVNCSPVSSLKSTPKLTIDQMLERWKL